MNATTINNIMKAHTAHEALLEINNDTTNNFHEYYTTMYNEAHEALRLEAVKANTKRNAIMNALNANGGATFLNGALLTPNKGYAVGTTNNTVTIKDLEAFDFETLEGTHGLWKDSKGTVYLDEVVIIKDWEEANLLARSYNQDYIYNFETQKEVEVV